MTLKTFTLFALCAAPVLAQNPVSAGQKFLYEMVRNNILRSAEKVPGE